MEGVTRAGRVQRNLNGKKPVGSKALTAAERKIRREKGKSSSKGNELPKGKIGDSKDAQIRTKTLAKQREQLSLQVSPEISPKRNIKFKSNAKSEPNILKSCLLKKAQKKVSPNLLIKSEGLAPERHSTGLIENRIAKMKTQLEHLQNHITTFTKRCSPLKSECLKFTV